MGTVYSAVHLGTQQLVALKVLQPQAGSSGTETLRFYREAQVTASLRHPNTVRVFDVGELDGGGGHFIAMELLRGPTLESVLSRGCLTQDDTIRMAIPVLRSLHEAHTNRLVHRDLKPSNIMLAETGDDEPSIKVLDFGIARSHESSLTETGTALGTPTFMSPEQGQGREIDGRSDLYSLGVLLFNCVVGQPPFVDDNPINIMLGHIMKPVPDLRVAAKTPVSDAFALCVAKALEKKPEDRFPDARSMRLALEEALGTRPGAENPPTVESGSTGPSSTGQPGPAEGLGSNPLARAESSDPTAPHVVAPAGSHRAPVGQRSLESRPESRRGRAVMTAGSGEGPARVSPAEVQRGVGTTSGAPLAPGAVAAPAPTPRPGAGAIPRPVRAGASGTLPGNDSSLTVAMQSPLAAVAPRLAVTGAVPVQAAPTLGKQPPSDRRWAVVLAAVAALALFGLGAWALLRNDSSSSTPSRPAAATPVLPAEPVKGTAATAEHAPPLAPLPTALPPAPTPTEPPQVTDPTPSAAPEVGSPGQPPVSDLASPASRPKTKWRRRPASTKPDPAATEPAGKAFHVPD
jgi:serine/threonine-protein kinase